METEYAELVGEFCLSSCESLACLNYCFASVSVVPSQCSLPVYSESCLNSSVPTVDELFCSSSTFDIIAEPSYFVSENCVDDVFITQALPSSFVDCSSLSDSREIMSTFVDFDVCSPTSSFTSVHNGLSEFSKFDLHSAPSLDLNDSSSPPFGLLLGLSSYLKPENECVLDLPDVCSEGAFYSNESSGIPENLDISNNRDDSPSDVKPDVSMVKEIFFETSSMFLPEASVLGVTGYERISPDELGTSNIVPPILTANATLPAESFSEEHLSLSNNEMTKYFDGSTPKKPKDFSSGACFRLSDYCDEKFKVRSGEPISKETAVYDEISPTVTEECGSRFPRDSAETVMNLEIDSLEKSASSRKSDLTYLAAASGANVAVEFTEEEEGEEEEDVESPEAHASTVKVPKHGDASQLVHSALDRSVRVLNRLQTYGFRGSISPTSFYSNQLNWHSSETKIRPPYKESSEESVKVLSQIQNDYPSTSVTNTEVHKMKEFDHDELDDFDGDSLEGFCIPFELDSAGDDASKIHTDEPKCERTGLSPIPETVIGDQFFKFDKELKADLEDQQDHPSKKEVLRHQYAIPDFTGSCRSISSISNILFTSEQDLQASSTPDESSKDSQSTVVNIGMLETSPVISPFLGKREETSDQREKENLDAYEFDNTQLLESRTTLASIESDLNLVNNETKLSCDNTTLDYSPSTLKKRSVNSLSNLLGSESLIRKEDSKTSTNFNSISVSQPIYTAGKKISAAQNEFHRSIEEHATSSPQLSQEQQIYTVKDSSKLKDIDVSNDQSNFSAPVIDETKKSKTSSDNITSSSLSEFERLEKELGTSDSTSPSSGHKGSGEDISSHTSSLSEYLRHEKECENCEDNFVLPSDSIIKSRLNEMMDVNTKVKAEVLIAPSLIAPSYGQISTIYEDVAENHTSSLSQSIESPTTSHYSTKEDNQTLFMNLYQKDENKSHTICSDSIVSVIHSTMSSDPLDVEQIAESLTSSSEIEILIDRADDQMSGLLEADSLIYSSIYDSLIPSGYENSIFEGTNAMVGTHYNWRDPLLRGRDSLEESEHGQVNKVTDSLCTTSSSAISNQMRKNGIEQSENDDQGITEFDSAHIDILHQQYFETIDEKDFCNLPLDETSLAENVSSTTPLELPQSTRPIGQKDSSESVSRVMNDELLNVLASANIMTDSLDDSNAAMDLINVTISPTLYSVPPAVGIFEVSSHPTQSRYDLTPNLLVHEPKANLSSPVIITSEAEHSSVAGEVRAPSTSKAYSPSSVNDSKMASNHEPNIFDISEGEVVVENKSVYDIQRQPLSSLLQQDNTIKENVSRVTQEQGAKEGVNSEKSQVDAKLLNEELTGSPANEAPTDSEYVIIDIKDAKGDSEQTTLFKKE
ncbi:unnamed protein product [Trichobilharzia szidati]|nr:unnamed protein product [Trichobilharzia szidati]